MILRILSTSRGTRRVVALSLVGVLGASAAEASAASLKDGWVHREVTATVDAASAPDESERSVPGLSPEAGTPSAPRSAGDPLPPSGPERPDHGHFGGADHCGHAHGAALTSSADMVFIATVMDAPTPAPLHRELQTTTPVRHPPRA